MQRARWFALALVLCTCAGWTAERPSLRLDEDSIRIRLLPAPLLELPVVNLTGKPVAGNFRLELMDRDGNSAAWTTGIFREEPGVSVEKIPWEAGRLPSNEPSVLAWYRLRYDFTPDAASGVGPARGVIQVGRVLRDTFELRMTAASHAVPGAKYPVRVRADDPRNGRPMAGVPVEVSLDIEGDDAAVKRKVVTNSSGYATATFNLPGTPQSDEVRVNATATRGPFEEHTYIDFKFPKGNRITLSTDKPLYQPGQTAHMRVTVFGANKHALAGAAVKFTIEDEESEEQFHQTVTTSRFGIASAEWDIPQKLRLGDYRIGVSVGDDDYGQQSKIRISRYDLPTYSVVITPDRPYFLPGQDANVEVRADYLFGKPVQHAKVRVVRRNEWQWSYRDQKWEGDETGPLEGQFDSSGKFIAHISLKEDFENFTPSRWRRFEDLDLAAYVTDLSTGRTEQRRFQLRLSALPIHLYLLNSGTESADAPLVLYVTSSYADGTPASVDGKIASFLPDHEDECDKEEDAGQPLPLASFHTNQSGVGRVELRPLALDRLALSKWARLYHNPGYENQRSGCLLLEGTDRKGNHGEEIEGLGLEVGRAFLSVRTDHALYRAGDPIAVSILSNTTVREVVIDLSGATGLLVSEVVYLDHGRAQVTFPYDPRFHGQLELTAFAIAGSGEKNSDLTGEHHVLFPGRQELQLMLRTAKAVFRPGEEAAADVAVRTPEGAPVESALGVLVYDRAVAERVRTDQQFGGEYGFNIYDFLDGYYGQGIAGITYRDLVAWDSTKPFPEGLDLIAEAILAYAGRDQSEGGAEFTGSGSYDGQGSRSVFGNLISHTTSVVSEALGKEYKDTDRYPHDAAGLKEILKSRGLDFDTTLDPWEVPYRAEFSVSGQSDVLALVSNGPDKRPGTEDDFTVLTLQWPYFRTLGRLINETVFAYQRKTGKYIRDYPTLRDEMKKLGTDLDALRDPWGRPYRFSFSIAGPYYNTLVTSAGPDGIFGSPKGQRVSDDVQEWSVAIHYFANETAAIEQALAGHYAKTGVFPHSELEFKTILDEAGLTPEQLMDPWGGPYHFSFSERSRYADQIRVQSQTVYGQEPRSVTTVTPVTQKVAYIEVLSDGDKAVQPARITVAEFSRVTAEQDARSMTAMPTPKQPPVAGGHGTVRGTVFDPSGAVVQNTKITLTSERDVPYFATTDSLGSYEFTALPTGFYQLRAEAPGFKASMVLSIPVQQGGVTVVDVRLQVSASSETVEVTAAAPTLESTSTQASSRVEPGHTEHAIQAPMFTPRLRKYFPETLLWRPEVITDKHGHARFNFTMAENITAWSMSVVATNEAGQAGIARKELRTFLPFFLEHEPPKVLTKGDTISVPVVLRNYLAKPQTLQTEMKAEPWFKVLSQPRSSVTVAPNADASTVFTFRADASIRHGKQQVTARNSATGDAVEHEIQVHPDGEEIAQTTSRLLAGGSTTFDVVVPDNAIGGSIDSELRVYPNLVAHVFDAMRGIGARPAGCAEQVTSTAYVSLLALQLLKKSRQDDPATPQNPRSALAKSARDAVDEGYLTLTALQSPDGGFRYWNQMNSDAVLTAYVLRFLSAAGEFVAVDGSVVRNARTYLVRQQQKSGAWTAWRWIPDQRGDYGLVAVEDANVTAYITRSFAESMSPGSDKQEDKAKNEDRAQIDQAFSAAMRYLEQRIDSWQDPYLVGNYAIAAASSHRADHIANARALLLQFAHREGAGIYWNLEANTTPFYGWGTAGRVETTALAMEALVRMQAGKPQDKPDDELRELIQGGLQYLLTHKDRYCIWYSTQATENVVEAIIYALRGGEEQAPAQDATLLVNGRAAGTLHLPSAKDVTGPVVLELPDALAKGNNKLEVSVPGGTAAMNAQIISTWYIPWPESSATTNQNFKPGDTRALRLQVGFDRSQPALGDTVTAHVEAERVGFRGYGMMLAEVGLPPGAEVDRESLESAGSYEVQPDRVVFYLWPSAGGTKFDFRFHLRYRSDAVTAPSLLYDYYNPENRAIVAPTRFIVH